MIIGLLTLAFLVFCKGHETILLDPNLQKSVNIYVKDKERKSEIDQVIKQVTKTEETFQKKMKDVYAKELVRLNLSRTSKPTEFVQEYNMFYQDVRTEMNSYIDAEMKFRSLTKENEWDSIMSRAAKQPNNVKLKKNLTEENNKYYQHLLATCNKYIQDAAGKTEALGLLDTYKRKVDSVADAFLDLNYRYLNALRPYSATTASFQSLRDNTISLRKNYSDYLVTMRFKLLPLVPGKDWETLAKELNPAFADISPGVSK